MNNTQMIHNQDNGVRLTTREPTSISKRPGDTGKHNIRDNVIQEEPWNLEKMMSRYNYINNYPCPAGQAPHTSIARLRVPQDLITNGLTAAPFNNFIFWNGRVKVQFQITGSPMVQGCIAAVFIPLTDPGVAVPNQLQNFSSLSINQSCYLFPNANTVAEMEIPFNSPQAYLNIADEETATVLNTLGYIYIIVFNTVSLSASTTDNVSVSVFSHFVDNQFKVPRRTTPAVSFVRAQSKNVPVKSRSSIVGAMTDLLLPDNPLADVIDLAAGFFGLDNPVDPSISEVDKVVITQRMNYSQGPEFIDRLSLLPSKTSTATSDTFASVQDEMTLSYLTKKYSYLGTFNLATSNSVGDILASFPMNPCPNRMTLVQAFQVPLLQYISMPFQLWKGGLNYKVQVVSTSFQTAKIFFSFNYNEFSPSDPTVLPATTSQYGTAIEINQGSNTFEFSIPYVSITPELYVPNSNTISDADTLGMINVSVLNPLISPNSSPTTIQFNIFIAGADDFEFSTLTAANNVLPSMEVTTSDTTFINKKLLQLKDISSHDFEILEIRPQSAAQPLITPMSNVDMATEDLVAPNPQTESRSDISQETSFSFRDILKKYHMYQRISYRNPTPDQNGLLFELKLSDLFGIRSYGPVVPPSPSAPTQLLWHLIQPMYRQYKGSLNFKIMLDSSPGNALQQFSVFYQPPTQSQSGDTTFLDNIRNQTYMPPSLAPLDYNQRTQIQSFPVSTRLPVSYVNSINKTAEISIPYSSRFLSILSRSSFLAENPLSNNELIDLGRLFIYTDFSNVLPDSVSDSHFLFNVYFSLGDDARFGTLYNVPWLNPNAYTDATASVFTSIYPDSYDTSAPIVNTLQVL
jgi:hypothetical protein